MAEYERSGQTARAFCQARKLNQHTFYGWRRELRRRDGQATSSGGRSGWPRRGRFVQVQVSGPSWLELAFDGLVLRVPASLEAARLTEILVAARKASG